MKVIVEEAESTALRDYLAGEHGRNVSSGLLRAEALRAVRHQGPEALASVREGLRRVDLVAIDDRILDAAGILEPAALRSLDAIHVATALAIGDDLQAIVTYSERMIKASALLGIPTASPS